MYLEIIALLCVMIAVAALVSRSNMVDIYRHHEKLYSKDRSAMVQRINELTKELDKANDQRELMFEDISTALEMYDMRLPDRFNIAPELPISSLVTDLCHEILLLEGASGELLGKQSAPLSCFSGNDADLQYWHECADCGTVVIDDHSDPNCLKKWGCPVCQIRAEFPLKFITTRKDTDDYCQHILLKIQKKDYRMVSKDRYVKMSDVCSFLVDCGFMEAWSEETQQALEALPSPVIELDHQDHHWECGDGCCDEYWTEVTVDGLTLEDQTEGISGPVRFMDSGDPRIIEHVLASKGITVRGIE